MTRTVTGRCSCVVRHSPRVTVLDLHHVLPISWGGGDEASNKVAICPNCHRNVHQLLNALRRGNGRVPSLLARRWNRYTRALATRGWDAYVASKEAP